MTMRKADLAAAGAAKKAFNLMSPAIVAGTPRGAPPPIAVLSPATPPPAATTAAWGKAVAAANEGLDAVASKLACGLSPGPPAAIGVAATAALLERQLSSRQQAAAQGMLSMLQLRCDGARHCYEVRLWPHHALAIFLGLKH
jgi:hypothetical protein